LLFDAVATTLRDELTHYRILRDCYMYAWVCRWCDHKSVKG